MDEKARTRHREYMREWRARNAESNREYQKQYSARYYAENADELRRRSAAWYAANKEQANEAGRKRNAARPKKGRPSGEAHPQWQGDNVSYDALHRWVVRHRGRPSLCVQCGSTAAKRFEWANVDHQYRRVLEDWLRLCTSCHRLYDYEKGLSNRGGPGNAGTPWKDGYPAARKPQ